MPALTKTRLRRKSIGFVRSYWAETITLLVVLNIILAMSNCNLYRKQHMQRQLPTTQQKIFFHDTPHASKAATMTDKEYMLSLPYGNLVWKTYGHESSYGKNDSCQRQGRYNGFGYAQSSFGYSCFSSAREVAKKVSDWFIHAINIAGMSAKQALCYYNQGKVMSDCDYAEYTLAL